MLERMGEHGLTRRTLLRAGAAGAVGLGVGRGGAAQAARPGHGYLMAYFLSSDEAVHYAVSEDALHWMALNGNRPVLRSTVGFQSVRDPFVDRVRGGYRLLSTNTRFTCGGTERAIVIWSSRDLIEWSDERLVEVADQSQCQAWAPEFVFDPEQGAWLVYWSSTENPDYPNAYQRIWGAWTRDFRGFTPAEVIFDPGFSVIDARIVRAPGRWVMVFKDERPGFKYIRGATARHAAGPWADVTDAIAPTGTEGPALLRVRRGWLMYYDFFQSGAGWGASFSSDLEQWTLVSDASFPDGARHGTVLPIDRHTLRALVARYG
jgi:hypothetical protein